MDGWWRDFVEACARAMTWATLRRLVLLLATLALLLALAQTAPLDLALLAAGDIVGYLELAGVVWLVAAQGHARGVLRRAATHARLGARKLVAAVARGLPKRLQRRIRPAELRAPRRRSAPAAANDNRRDDEGISAPDHACGTVLPGR